MAKKMSNKAIVATVEALFAAKEKQAAINAEVAELEKALKEQCELRNTEELDVKPYIIRWTTVLSNKFDTTLFKKSHAALYKQFTKSSTSRRFSVSK